ncbi:protein FAR-RED IMPAIRED RESPONSE 1-like [Lotus japonicus]|uniref:protein FAR-RED IMPAIRED RESPONSE 1-like n=1 Tax=Lotus japonicus TaxID=34305 RepID=UPI002587E273|nr:protein FAR-RED IMPAIRED RESPONSE 1-like [Lotus japonicus]
MEPKHLNPILPEQVVVRWESVRCESLIAGLQKNYCPFKNCSVVMVDDGGENEIVTSAECHSCHRLFCAQSSHEDAEPKVGMTFNSEDEANRYYKNYARLMGFGVCKINSKNGDDGKKYITIGCSRARKYKNNSKNLLKPNPTTKTECKARLSACVSSDGTVVVSRVNLGHNHDLSPTKARFLRCNKNLEPRIKRRLELNDQVGINVSRNFRAFVVEANGYDNLTFGEKDCRNYIDKVRRLRLGTGDAQAIQNYFVRKQKQNSQFYYVMDVDDDSHLRNVFWADARSRIAYEYFGEVITFDTTYLTNKYDMPFAPFVGVNHHGHSLLLGCALLSNEDTQTFTWLFSRWLECMHGRAPNAIITDQDRTMKNAIEAVFPKARHRWCLGHIMKKVPEKLGRHSNYESIKKLLHGAVYDSFSRSDFMERWEKMIKDYELHDNDWLKGLFDERDRWVPVFLRDTFWAGMSTTQRSESMNSFFDGYVNSKTTLKQFVEQYDNALRDKIEKESLADFGSFNTEIACVSIFGFESQFQKAFTNAKFKEFQVEIASMMYCNTFFEKMDGLQSIYSVTETKKVFDKMKDIVFKISFNEEDCQFQCTCLLFEFRGILCRHILSVLKLTGKTDSVPSCYVLSRWRKDIKRKHTLVKCGFDNLAGNTELQRLNKACDAFYEAASVGINTDDDLVTVMNWINSLKNELSCKETPPEMNTAPITDQDNSIQEEGTKILDPKVTRGKGQRPPSKRKASKVDQIVNKKIATKKTQEGNQKSKNVQSQNKGSSTSSVHVNKNDGFIRSQIINEIGTQESIQDGQSCFLSGNGIINHLAPFNPNQNHIGQVPYYAQIVNRGIGYYELVQGLVGEDESNAEGGVGSPPLPEETLIGQGAPESAASIAHQSVPSSDHVSQQVEESSPQASPVHPTSFSDEDQTPIASPPLRQSSPAVSHLNTDGKENPPSNQPPTLVDFMLSDPFFVNMKGAKNPDLDEVEELRQKAESYRLATLEAYGERDKLLTQVAAQVTKLNNLGIEMHDRETDLSTCERRVEDKVDDMQKELEARAEAIAASRAACVAKDKELASLRSELALSNESLAAVRTQLEAKAKAAAEAEIRAASEAKTLRARLEVEAAAEAVEERGRGFFLAKAQVQYLYEGIDLSGMGAFKKVTPESLIGPDHPTGFDAAYFAAAANTKRAENVNAV